MSLRLRIVLAAALLAAAIGAAVISRDTLILGLAFAALSALLGLSLALSVLQPLSSIRRTALAIAAGDFNARAQFESKPPAEIAELSDAFNQMISQVQGQVASAGQERERLLAAMNSSTNAFVAVDHESRVLFINTAAESLFGYTSQRIVGNPLVWIVPDDAVLDAVRRSLQRGSQESAALERSAERGGRQYLQAVITPIVGGGDWANLVVFNDVTEIRRTELIRRDFVANVSHELRSPLAGLKAVIETLTGGAIDDKRAAREFLERADIEIDRLVELVEELLELSRIEYADVPMALQPTNLRHLLEEVIERMRPQAERKHQSLSASLIELPVMQIDGPRIERALVNLLHNAIKFAPENGAIALETEIKDSGVLIHVSDDGVGIAREELPRIFERFYKSDTSRAGDSGTGLGLAIVKHTMEAHGGSVSVESTLGRGARFTLTLPLPAQGIATASG